ncbi:MAG TPA: cupredoxin domain-containing protein [Mycobacteriales bacterium]|jgi:plastocyanin|nr:cupredoxin domain-containing protein [Mycobacteriales bacterium]
MKRLVTLGVGAAAVALTIAACSSGSSGSSSAAPSSASTTSASSGSSTAAGAITIQSFAFGSPLTVAPGTTITVTNKDPVDHDVVSDDAGMFRTPAIHQNESATFTAPTAPGTYKFSCTFHPQMKGIGTLIVQG